MTSYLVTGGAGFIGSHIATALVERGDKVRVLDNLSTGARGNLAHVAGKIDFVEGDVFDLKQVEQAVAGCDVVFHQGPTDLLDHAAPVCCVGHKMGIDATRKFPEEGHPREWPDEMLMSDEVIARVSKRWSEYGIGPDPGEVGRRLHAHGKPK